MGFPFSRFLRKPVKGDEDDGAPPREDDSRAEGGSQSESAPDKQPAAASQSGSSGKSPSSGSSPVQTNRLQDRIVKPIPIREPKSQKQQKKISARIHIPPISLRQPDDDMPEFKTTPRTALPPAPRRSGNAARTPMPRRTRRTPAPESPASAENKAPGQAPGTSADPSQDNLISAPFNRNKETPTPKPQSPAPGETSPPPSARAEPPEDPPKPSPKQENTARSTPKPETHRQLPSNFRVGTPATPSLGTPAKQQQRTAPEPSQAGKQTPSQAAPPPRQPRQHTKSAPATAQRRPGSNRLKLPSRPPMLSVPPKFGPRVDEPERDPSRPKERKEIHLKKSPAPDTSPAGDKADDAKKHQDQPAPATSEDQHPELNMKTAANIPAVPEQSKQLFAGKIAKPQVPQQAKRPQISPQQKLTSNVPPVPRRPDQKNQPENKSAPEKAPPQSTRDEKEIEYISFNQAEEEFGPLKVNGSHHQDPEDPAVPRDHDPAVPSGRQTSAVAPLPRRETARIPLPRNRFSRAAAENPPRQTAAPRAHDTRESSPDADADAPASRNGHHAPAQFTPDSQFDNPVLREIFLTDDPLDLDKIAQLTTDFPGITHCFIILRTPEGDQLAGTLPSDWDRRQFSRKALDFAHKTSDSTEPLGIGNSSVFTLYCEAGIISFFTGDQICVSVKHHQRGFLPGVREKLQRVTEELGNILLTSTSN